MHSTPLVSGLSLVAALVFCLNCQGQDDATPTSPAGGPAATPSPGGFNGISPVLGPNQYAPPEETEGEAALPPANAPFVVPPTQETIVVPGRVPIQTDEAPAIPSSGADLNK